MKIPLKLYEVRVLLGKFPILWRLWIAPLRREVFARSAFIMRNTVSAVLAVWPWGAKAVNWLNMHPARQKVSCLYHYTGQRITSEMTQLFKYLLSEEKRLQHCPEKKMEHYGSQWTRRRSLVF